MARHANVSKATIYSRVANKEELIEAVIQRESDLTIKKLNQATAMVGGLCLTNH
ncbi:TetR/AcrR family transcriptional regulator [bacterium M00.F.Ca.ET.194.01.1.1]|nr:TetR/AcrR family transcriptional regulator [bacterium M00.F.Ca.ET.194.01.1.1]TGS57517.1 TetR/AcrR family transcriptional regulator [bacterium M00.F.Ca.ET.179.01.1.1]TGV50449.1 TetR/AcrR family transcriptional regulator [bacterium M00.F.Ca.ET.168.01.1.1]